jgi:hypothetical protein
MRDGREIIDIKKPAGMAEYLRRKRVMWERQGKRCCLEGHIAGCKGAIAFEESVFEHEHGRGLSGSHRDDRVEIRGKWQNGAACVSCNTLKGSVRIAYND